LHQADIISFRSCLKLVLRILYQAAVTFPKLTIADKSGNLASALEKFRPVGGSKN
jgi:hypothetical protein